MFSRFLDVIRVCARCGSVAGQSAIFCTRCRTMEEQLALHSGWNFEDSIRHHFLFSVCKPNNDHHYQQLLAMKERDCPVLQAWLVGLLRQKRILLNPTMFSSPLVIPAPSSTGRRHAHRLAKELSHQTGWEYRELFHKKKKSQKESAGWFERESVEVELIDRPIQKAHFVFVDDLVTTGATARACLQALDGVVKSFEVWAPYRTVLLRPYGPSDITQPDEKAECCNSFNIFNGQW